MMHTTNTSAAKQRKYSLATYPSFESNNTSDYTVAWAQETCTFPSRTLSWVRSQRVSLDHGDYVPCLAGLPSSSASVSEARRPPAPMPPPPAIPRKASRRQSSTISKVQSHFGVIDSCKTVYDKGYSISQSAAPSFQHLEKRRLPSRRGLRELVGQMYGKDACDQNLAEFGATEPLATVEYPTRSKRAVLLIGAIIPYIIGSIDHTIIATLIPTFISKFNEPADIGWYASAYFLPFALLMPTLGKCYSLWNIKWIFLTSLIFLITGSMVCALSSKSMEFIAGRTLSGSGAAGILQGSMRIIAIALPGTQRIYMEGIGAIMMGACIMSGPLIGGAIADNIGWQWAFWINVPPATLSFLGVVFFFPKEVPRTPLFTLSTIEKIKRLDPIGSALLIAALSCLISVLQNYSYSLELEISNTDIGISVLAGVAFVLFLAQETFIRPDLALIPRSLIRRRSVWACSIMLFMVFAGFTNFVFFMSIFQQVVQGESASDSALHMLPYVISATVAAGVTSFGSTILRYYNPFFIIGGALFTIGMGFVSQIDDDISQWTKFSYEVLVGTGVGLTVLGNIAPCHIDLPEEYHAIGNGMTGLGGALGASIAVPISSALFNRAFREGIETLDVPLSVKLVAVQNITMIAENVPPEYLEPVLDLLAAAVQKTFLFGLSCAIICVLATIAIPWKPLQILQAAAAVVRGGATLPLWKKQHSEKP